MLPLIYLVMLPVCLLCSVVFFTTSLKEWRWQRWFFIFTAANVADLMSTFFVAFTYDWNWSYELNFVMTLLSPYLGLGAAFGVALVLFKLFVIAIAYQAGIHLGKFEITRCMFFISSSGLFLLALNNTIRGWAALTTST